MKVMVVFVGPVLFANSLNPHMDGFSLLYKEVLETLQVKYVSPRQPACNNPAVVKADFYQISKSSKQTLQDGGLSPPSPNSTSKPVMSWENMERTLPVFSSPRLLGFDSHIVCFPGEKAEVTGRRGGVTCPGPQAAQGLQGLWPVVDGDPPPSPWEPMPPRFLKAKVSHSADGESEAQSGGDLPLAQQEAGRRVAHTEK